MSRTAACPGSALSSSIRGEVGELTARQFADQLATLAPRQMPVSDLLTVDRSTVS